MIKNLFKNFLIILLFTTGLGGKAFSADVNFFTIGTGGTAYTYYPVGGMIANAISNPQDLENVEKVEVVGYQI